MKSNQTLKILFWHRKSKADSKGLAPIICRISIDGKDEEFSTSQKVHISEWDVETKKVIRSADSKKINSALNHIESSLEVNFTVLKTQYDSVSPLMLKNIYHNFPINGKKHEVKENKIPLLLELTEIHIKDFSELVEKKLRSKETLKQWKATQKKISEFLKFEFKVTDLSLADIEYSFAQKFYKYLAVKRIPTLKDAATMKQIKNLKQILNIAEANLWIPKNPIGKFKCGSEDPEIIPLEIFEVEKLWRKKIGIERLAKVRKELSDICKIGKPLNSHLARHTFADIMLNVLNFPLEDVSKMLGHKNIRTTQRYARVKKSRIGKTMNEAKSILFEDNGELKNAFNKQG